MTKMSPLDSSHENRLAELHRRFKPLPSVPRWKAGRTNTADKGHVRQTSATMSPACSHDGSSMLSAAQNLHIAIRYRTTSLA